MTKRFLILFAICFMLMPVLDAYANVIMPPFSLTSQPGTHPAPTPSSLMRTQNSFFLEHRNERVRLERYFFANGESGSVSVKDAPNSNIEIAVLENDAAYFISYTLNYQGELWGFLYQNLTRRPRNFYGWIPMNRLLLKYDRISFTEEYEGEFYPFTGSYEALTTAEEVVLWRWPGSGTWRRGIVDTERIRSISSSHAFLDKHGREWVFFDHFPSGRNRLIRRNIPNVWIYLSDPSNRDIPAFNPPRPVAWQPAGTDISTVADISINTDNPTSEPPISELIIILVAGLSVSTATLIRVFWKPNKRA